MILQGERDPFGRREEIEEYALSKSISVAYLPDGDHDLKPRKASGLTHDQNLTAALDAADDFLKGLASTL